MSIRPILVMACILLIAGCAQPQLSSRLASMNSRCDFSADERFASLRGKIPLSPEEMSVSPTAGELSNSEKPTARERSALREYDLAVKPCLNELLDLASRALPPEAAVYLQRVAFEGTKLRGALIQGHLTFGQYRATVYQMDLSAQEYLAQVVARQMAAEQAAQQAFSAALMQAGAQLSAVGQPAAPAWHSKSFVTTSCRRTGSFVNCSSF